MSPLQKYAARQYLVEKLAQAMMPAPGAQQVVKPIAPDVARLPRKISRIPPAVKVKPIKALPVAAPVKKLPGLSPADKTRRRFAGQYTFPGRKPMQ